MMALYLETDFFTGQNPRDIPGYISSVRKETALCFFPFNKIRDKCEKYQSYNQTQREIYRERLFSGHNHESYV